jgi:Right handed beta helix region
MTILKGLQIVVGSSTGNGIRGRFSKLIVLVSMLILGGVRAPASNGGTVSLKPGDNVPTIVANSPAGTTFQFAAGPYQLTAPVVPLTGDSFIGAPNRMTILSGSTVLSSFTQQGSYWTALLTLNHTNPVCGSGKACECRPTFPGCDLTEDLFIDNQVQQRVTALSDVTSGKWFWDLSNGTIYLAANPNGHQVDVSTTAQAFTGVARNVTIKGLVIEKFAAQGVFAGKPGGQNGVGWIVENCTVEFSHLAGVNTGSQMQILNNTICDNGKLGIFGNGDSNLIQGNELCRNDYAGFFAVSGGAYLSGATNLVVSGNNVHDNLNVGLHTDGGSETVLYEGNTTARNDGSGIVHEISHAATIRNNTSDSDVFSGGAAVGYGAGILVEESDNVEIYGNTVTNSMNGIAGYQVVRVDDLGTHILSNLWVHDNVVTLQQGAAGGIQIYTKDPSYYPAIFTTLNNHFDNNTYCLANASGNYFDWQVTAVSFDVWQKTYGQDVHSVLSCSTTTAPAPPPPPPTPVANFSILPTSGSATSQTVAPGQTTSFTANLAGINGFSGSVSLACSGLPAQSTCALSPVSISLAGTATENATITVSTTASSLTTGAKPPSTVTPSFHLRASSGVWLFAMTMWLILLGAYKKTPSGRWRSIPALGTLAIMIVMLSSCAMAVKSSTSTAAPPPITQPGTPAGSSTIVVTATSGSLTHSTQFTLTVN